MKAAAPLDPASYHSYVVALAWKVAQARSLPASVDANDLAVAGMIALIECTKRFDPDRGVPFLGYASRRIVGAMYDTVRGGYPVPNRRTGPQPALFSINDERTERAEFVDLSAVDPEAEAVAADMAVRLHAAVDALLSSRERTVCDWYYFDGRPLSDLCPIWSVTISRVSQIHASALRHLRGDPALAA